jgi:hypothetical protein
VGQIYFEELEIFCTPAHSPVIFERTMLLEEAHFGECCIVEAAVHHLCSRP